MRLSILSTLPVALTIMVKGKTLTSKQIEFSDISSTELIQTRLTALDGEFLKLHEYRAKLKLIDSKGTKHEVPYDVLAVMTSVNLKKLEELDFELLEKLQAESSENPSS